MKLHTMLFTWILQKDVLKILGNFQNNIHDGVRLSKFTDPNFEIKINFETLKKINRLIHNLNLAKKLSKISFTLFSFPQKLQYKLHLDINSTFESVGKKMHPDLF